MFAMLFMVAICAGIWLLSLAINAEDKLEDNGITDEMMDVENSEELDNMMQSEEEDM